MKLVYFAWVRERMGRADEQLDKPEGVETVADLINWLQARDEQGAYAFEQAEIIRAAINQEHVSHDMGLSDDDEVAFFPPMTGG